MLSSQLGNKLFRCLSIAVLLLFSGMVLANQLHESNKWRLQFSGSARADGEIVLTLTPKGGQAISVTIAVPAGTSENAVAKLVVEALKQKLPADAFHVERDDGEDVLIKKRHGAANFSVEVTSNTVKHVRINPDRE